MKSAEERNAGHMAKLVPEVAELAKRHIEACSAEGIELVIVQSVRTMEEQAAIYARGRTASGKAVTAAKPGMSWHNYGRAYDVAVIEGGRIDWKSPKYARAGELGKSLGLVWGGDFKSVRGDLGHFEFHPGMRLKKV